MTKKRFAHLHVHTDYSLLDGACRINDLTKKAKSLKIDAMAITDHGNLFGAIHFYRAALSNGLKPIIGYEAYVAPGKRTERDSRGIRDAAFHLTLLAENYTGYKNLISLSTTAYRDGFYYKPRIDKEILASNREGIICLSGCMHSQIAHLITTGQEEAAEKTAAEYADIFGKENFFLEVHDHNIPEQKKVNATLSDISRKLGLELVATNDVHYIKKEDARAHDILLCIATGKLVHAEDRLRFHSDEFYLKSYDEMLSTLPDFHQAIANTWAIAERCHVKIDFDEKHLPVFQAHPEMTNDAFLRELCMKGLQERYPVVTDEILHRMNYELDIIQRKGFSSYMLIVWDLINFARRNGIAVGPGRGSAAGSLVAYCLGITEIDPLRYDLIFERFLNPERTELPDIDIDFARGGREKVISYVKEKYHLDNVAHITTFGTMAARAALRDTGRVLGFNLSEIDAIAKKIPQTPGTKVSLREAIEKDPELKNLYESSPAHRELIDIATKIEGLNRHASTHAAGIVIADKPLTHYLPLYIADGEAVTQYDMEAIEKIGLLKMDILSLNTLNMIEKAVELIRANHGIQIDFANLPLDDKPTYRLLSKGETKGVFQLESSGMRDLLKKLQPECFEDIIALLAIYRPGPIGGGVVDTFIKRKHGKEKIEYPHKSIEPILKETHGIILYQEQVMRIAQKLAGFSLAEGDSLRKAMGKKRPEILAQYRDRFISGATANKVDPKTAEDIFELINYFAGYGFNKSHSASYAMLSYRTAYLKANYPTEFMAALLSCESGNTDKVMEYVKECRRMGIAVLPPDINESHLDFSVSNGKIRFGLGALKNVGEKALESILHARTRLGTFKSLLHFCEHVDLRVVNRNVISSLIRAGAFDSFGFPRAALDAVIDKAIDIGAAASHARRSGQQSLLDHFAPSGSTADRQAIPNIPEWPENKLLTYEKEALGFHLTSSPLSKFENVISQYSSVSTGRLHSLSDSQEITIGGMILDIRTKPIKSGKNAGRKMAILRIEDMEGICEAIVFPPELEKYSQHVHPDKVAFFRGKLDLSGEEPTIKVSEIIPIEKSREALTNSITITIKTLGLEEKTLSHLQDTIRSHPGRCPVFIEFITPSGQKVKMKVASEFFVSPTEHFINEVEDLIGEHCIKFA